MATKYILAGGLDRANPEYWDNLGKEIQLNQPVKLLSCFFSMPKSDWEEKFAGFKPFFKKAFGGDARYELASPDKFLEQVRSSDVIYLHGGSSHRLKAVLARYKNLKSLFAGKVIIGSSAGANYLSELGWSPNLREPIKGAGLVPLNVIVHWGSSFADDEVLGPINWDDARQQLTKILPAGATITPILEGKFIVYVDENN